MKHLMINCAAEGTCYDKALHAYRCTNRVDCFSPFHMYFGHTGKSLLPTLQAALYPTNPAAAAEARHKATEKWAAACADRRRKCIYHTRDFVFVQDPIGGTWGKGRVKESNVAGSYVVEFEDSACKSQNEKYLRLRKSVRAPDSVKSDPHPLITPPPRRMITPLSLYPQIPSVSIDPPAWPPSRPSSSRRRCRPPP